MNQYTSVNTRLTPTQHHRATQFTPQHSTSTPFHRIITQISSTSNFNDYVMELQQNIIKQTKKEIELGDAKFDQHPWTRGGPDSETSSSGQGVTAVLSGGQVIEKGAVNTTVITGVLTPTRAKNMSERRSVIDPAGGQQYSAAAMSLVFHSGHPLIPTLRADVRLFEVQGTRWFGGGCDLTPFYLFDEDHVGFHKHWQSVCSKYDKDLYKQYKAECDRYFYLPSRKEHRGTGGIFFDDLSSLEQEGDSEEEAAALSPEERAQQFVQDVGNSLVDVWVPIVNKRRNLEYTEEQRQWQLIRRGRYIEFNLLYDRGVRFGLEGGRIESIMVSAPPLVAWQYDVQPKDDEQKRLLEILKSPIDWVK